MLISLFCFVCLGVLKTVSCEYDCRIVSVELHCTGLVETHMYQEISARVTKSSISSLNITNSFLPVITPKTLQGFESVGSIYLTSSEVSVIEDGTFDNFTSLSILNLSDNFLAEFNMKAVPPKNSIYALDLSNNALNNFSKFNISHFPRISILNLENNLLEYLPVNILDKLKVENEFYLLAGHNPWNCNHSTWTNHLNINMTSAFCSSNFSTHLPKIRSERHKILAESQNDTELTKPHHPNCAKCSFYFCVLWLIGGIWLGIIIGNIGKIKTLLCNGDPKRTDASVQSDYHQMELRSLHPNGSVLSGKDTGEKSKETSKL